MNNSPEKFFQLSGKIFPESWKNFSGELQLKLKLIFFLQVEKSQEKNLNNSLGNRKVQNNPENAIENHNEYSRKSKSQLIYSFRYLNEIN